MEALKGSVALRVHYELDGTDSIGYICAGDFLCPGYWVILEAEKCGVIGSKNGGVAANNGLNGRVLLESFFDKLSDGGPVPASRMPKIAV